MERDNSDFLLSIWQVRTSFFYYLSYKQFALNELSRDGLLTSFSRKKEISGKKFETNEINNLKSIKCVLDNFFMTSYRTTSAFSHYYDNFNTKTSDLKSVGPFNVNLQYKNTRYFYNSMGTQKMFSLYLTKYLTEMK